MWYLWVGVGVVLVIAIYFAMDTGKSTAIKNFKEKVSKINPEITIKDSANHLYDLEIKMDDKNYLVKLVEVPSSSNISINNKITYEAHYGGGKHPGASQPYSKYLNNVKDFINSEIDASYQKVIVFFPQPKEIVKWINENEMIIVEPHTDVYGLNLMGINQTKYWTKKENIS